MDSKLIIGGGISGLVFQMYHPEFTIITPDIGGLFGSYIATIHDTTETRKLLKDLGWSNPEFLSKKEYLGYFHKGWIQETLTPELNLLLIQKKMSLWNEPIDKSFVPESFDMSTSKTANYMMALDVDPSEVLKRISPGKIIEGKVVEITDDYVSLEDGRTFPYKELVSTIAAPFFWKAFGREQEFLSKPVTNIISIQKPPWFDDRFHFVYYDDSLPFSRITKLQGKYAIEFTGVLSKQDFQELYPDYGEVDIVPVRFGRIQSTLQNEPPNHRITFLGRFAQWKYGITLENVIKQTLEYEN